MANWLEFTLQYRAFCRQKSKDLHRYVTIGMMELTSKSEPTLEIARERGIARARDFTEAGIPTVHLQRLCRDDALQKRKTIQAEVWTYAASNSVGNVMPPYIEASS